MNNGKRDGYSGEQAPDENAEQPQMREGGGPHEPGYEPNVPDPMKVPMAAPKSPRDQDMEQWRLAQVQMAEVTNWGMHSPSSSTILMPSRLSWVT